MNHNSITVLTRNDFKRKTDSYLDMSYIKSKVKERVQQADFVVIDICERKEILRSKFAPDSNEFNALLINSQIENQQAVVQRFIDRIKAPDQAVDFHSKGNKLTAQEVYWLMHMLGLEKIKPFKEEIAYRNRWSNGRVQKKEFLKLECHGILEKSVTNDGTYWYYVSAKGREVLKTYVGNFHYDEF